MGSPRWKKLSPLIDELLELASRDDSRDLIVQYSKISQILNEIQRIEPELKDSAASRESSLKSLLDWFTSNGGVLGDISIHDYGQVGYGVKAEVDLAEGQLICAIPRKLVFTIENVQECMKNQRANDPILKNMDNVALALFLVMERVTGTKSFWHPYIKSLPNKYMTVLYFSLDDLSSLKGSPVLEPALKLCKSIARQYAYFKKLFETCKDEGSRILRHEFSYQLYRWGVSTVMTRQNCIPFEGKIISALIPVWDMCNHANGRITTGYNDDTNRCECLAQRNFIKNEQVFIFYGARSNAEFFLHNGFVYPENQFDSYRLCLGISEADPSYSSKSSLLNRINVKTKGDFFLHNGAEPVDGELIAFLRVFNMDKDKLKEWLDSSETNTLKSVESVFDFDMKAWNYLATRIKLLLYSYANLNQQESRGESTAIRMIRSQKTTEKILLLKAMEYVERRMI